VASLQTCGDDPGGPQFAVFVPTWNAGDTDPARERTLPVVDIRDDDADQPPVLVVEDLPGSATSAAS
jgi:hypothetical protein